MTNQDDEAYIRNIEIDAHEWRGIQNLANAGLDFEPLEKRAHLGLTVLDRLIGLQIAQTGPTSDRYLGIGMTTGYRLTELGWRVKERGRHPRHGS